MQRVPAPPRVTAPSIEQFQRDWVRTRRPVIIANAIDHWPARSLWNADHFRTRHGTQKVTVAKTVDGQLARDPSVGIDYRDMSVRDAIDAVFSGNGPNFYLIGTLETTLREVFDEVRVPDYCRNRPRLRSRLWISAAETVSPLHRDFPDNLFAQVIGTKRFTILSPTQNSRVYEHSFRSKLPRVSAVDPEQPDFDRFPLFEGATLSTFDVAAGELLYLPGGWWHHVRTLDASYSINWWWAEGFTRVLVTAADVYKRLRSVRL